MIIIIKYSYHYLGDDFLKRVLKLLLICIIFITYALLLFFNIDAAIGVIEGIKLTIEIIVPSLFIFTVITIFFLKCGGANPLFNHLGIPATVYILSLFGGYPSGALCLNELYGSKVINDKQLENFLIFSINAGPSFIYSAIGQGIFGSKTIGLFLLISNTITSFLPCLFYSIKNKGNNKKVSKKEPIFSALVKSTESGVYAMLKIAGTVVFISGIFSILTALKVPYIEKFLAFFEITTGIKQNPENLNLAAFLIGFSGVSVLIQIKLILKDIKINFIKIFTAKCFQGFMNVLLVKILVSAFPTAIEVISNGNAVYEKAFIVSLPTSIAFLLLCVFYIYEIDTLKLN